MLPTPNDREYWDNRYVAGQTGWDLGEVSTPLKAYIDQYENRQASILILGCGNAYEAAYLLDQGFSNVTIIDISPAAIEKVRARLKAYDGKELQIICTDFFKIDQSFDLVLEQTFFCALPPTARQSYVDKMREILNPNGKLAGVLFDRQFEGGPPFGGTAAEYKALFSGKLKIQLMEPCYNSVKPRAGTELFFIMKNAVDNK